MKKMDKISFPNKALELMIRTKAPFLPKYSLAVYLGSKYKGTGKFFVSILFGFGKPKELQLLQLRGGNLDYYMNSINKLVGKELVKSEKTKYQGRIVTNYYYLDWNVLREIVSADVKEFVIEKNPQNFRPLSNEELVFQLALVLNKIVKKREFEKNKKHKGTLAGGLNELWKIWKSEQVDKEKLNLLKKYALTIYFTAPEFFLEFFDALKKTVPVYHSDELTSTYETKMAELIEKRDSGSHEELMKMIGITQNKK